MVRQHTGMPHIVAALAAMAFGIQAWWVLSNGYLADDAYILFSYVENLAAGNGIAFYPGGAPAEGATDFLWMIFLSGLVALGLDVAVASLLLNMAGAYLLAFILARRTMAGPGWGLHNLHLPLLAVLVAISWIANAGLAGFGTVFYAGFCLLLLDILLDEEDGRLLWIPVLGLFVGLIRPDGVVIGVVATLVALIRVRRRPILLRYVGVAALAAIAGLAYFAWRYSYFGLLLPLPLYVKGTIGNPFAGWAGNRLWMVFNLPLLLLLPFGAGLLRVSPRKYILALLPFAALFVALSFVQQWQNVATRFQAPLSGVLLYVLAAFLASATRAGATSRRRAVAGVLAVLTAGFWTTAIFLKIGVLTTPDYTDDFAKRLGGIVGPDAVLAITEAGRLSFWTDARIVDLVGLNTPETALNRLEGDLLERIAPDVIMLNTAGVPTVPAELYGGRPFMVLDVDTVVSLVPDHITRANRDNLPSNRRIPLVVYDYLKSKPGLYTVVVVRYREEHMHLYAVRLDSVDIAVFLEELRVSSELSNFTSYFELRNTPTKARR